MKILTHAFHTVIEYYWMKNLPEANFYRGDILDRPWWWGYELRPKPNNCILTPSKHYDLAIAHTPEGYRWIRNQFNGPIIYWFHQYPDITTRKKVDKLELTLNIPTVYYSIEEDNAWNIGDKHIIKHGIDTSVFNGWIGDRKKAMCLNSSSTSNWGDMKGHDFLIRLREIWSRAFYSVYGGDVYLVTEEDVLEIMRKYRVYMNIAWKLDRSPLEAMACGMPVIARNTPEFTLKKYFKDGENIIFVDTPEEMRDKVMQLLDNWEECKRIGINARATIDKYFSIQQNKADWLSLFDEVINKHE